MLRIGELARRTRESVKTIRFWENEDLLAAERSDSGYRHFPERMVERVAFIRSAQALGFTLEEIREILDLRSEGARPCDDVRDALTAHLQTVCSRIRELRALEADLTQRLAWANHHPDPDCADAEGCIYVQAPVS